jgi:two-component system, OmpR family, KDP operon response regulator KdpE
LINSYKMVAQKILLIDDQAESSRVLGAALSIHGYDVRMIDANAHGLESIADWSPDLVIVNLPLSIIRAVELCRELRRRLHSAFIIVLSHSGGEDTTVKALESGADSYIAESFSVNEILARVRAGLRRVEHSVLENETRSEVSIIEAGHFCINLLSRRTTIEGREIQLSPKEFDLLCYLARHPQRVIARETLIAVVWKNTNKDQTEYLHVLMNRLRRKIEPEGSSVRYIVTEKWVGYRFEPHGVTGAASSVV